MKKTNVKTNKKQVVKEEIMNKDYIDFGYVVSDFAECGDERTNDHDNFGRDYDNPDYVKKTYVEVDNDERIPTVEDFAEYDLTKWYKARITLVQVFRDSDEDEIHHAIITYNVMFGDVKVEGTAYCGRLVYNAIKKNAKVFNKKQLVGKECMVNFTKNGKYTNTYFAFNNEQVVERIQWVLSLNKKEDAMNFRTDCSKARAILEMPIANED